MVNFNIFDFPFQISKSKHYDTFNSIKINHLHKLFTFIREIIIKCEFVKYGLVHNNSEYFGYSFLVLNDCKAWKKENLKKNNHSKRS